jgi:hypothetical protein
MIEGMNIKLENVWMEDGAKSVVVNWNLAGKTKKKIRKFQSYEPTSG